MSFYHPRKEIYQQSNKTAAMLDFGRQEQKRKRYSLANSKNGFSRKNTLEKLIRQL